MSNKKLSSEELSTAENILNNIAIKAKLEEGYEAVRKILREIFRFGSLGTKALARKLLLPIPTIAAVRKELEGIGFIDRNQKGAVLTRKGIDFVTNNLNISYLFDLSCKHCEGRTITNPHDFEELLQKMKEFTAQRPQPKTELDQAYSKPITALQRAFLMLENGDLEGRNILLLGDDDFTSLAISLLQLKTNITVIDIDQRLLDIISSIAKENNFAITCIHMDLRKPIPINLQKNFDVFLTDPPYTPSGLSLFLSRGLQALKQGRNHSIYLAYAHRAPNQLLEVQKTILSCGLALKQILPGFNIYEGAEMHGNTTFLAILSTTDEINMPYPEEYSGNIYTGEFNPTARIYQCSNGHEIFVGINGDFKTIEELKLSGCPQCKSTESFLRVKTIKDDFHQRI